MFLNNHIFNAILKLEKHILSKSKNNNVLKMINNNI
jgi:hypothetical protein